MYAEPRPPGEITNLGRLGSLPEAFAIFVALVGVAGVLHALVATIRRRRHDFAVLRSMGFVRGQTRATIAWQASTLAVVALVIGLPAGLVVGRWTWIVVANGVGAANDPNLPALVAVVLIPAAFVVANVLAAPVGVRAGRISPATVLRTE